MERYHAIDTVKFFAILFVVVLHVNPIATNNDLLTFVIDTFARFAVPFFFITAGFLLGQKTFDKNKLDVYDYFKKYLFKLLKIYILCLMLYILYDIAYSIFISFRFNYELYYELRKYFELFSFMNLVYYGNVTSGIHIWFLPALIWSGLFLLLGIRLNKVNILLIISLLLHLFGLFGQGYKGIIQIPIITRDTFFFGLFYTTLGYYFSSKITLIKFKLEGKKGFLIFFFTFSVIQIAEHYILFSMYGSHGNYFLSTIFVTVFLFCYIISNPQLGKKTLLEKIGKNSLGIYLIHVLFIQFFNTIFHILNIQNWVEGGLGKVLFIIIIFFFSHFAYLFIQKVIIEFLNNNANLKKTVDI